MMKLGVKGRLTILISGISTIPLLLFSVYTFNQQKEALLSRGGAQYRQAAVHGIQTIEQLFNIASESVRTWSLMDQLKQVDENTQVEVNSTLALQAESYRFFYDIYITNLDGLIIASSDEDLIDETISGQDWLFKASQKFGQIHIGGLQFDPLTYNYVIPLAAAISDDRGSSTGYLVALLSWTELLEIINDVKLGGEISKDRYTVLIDGDGSVIAAPEFMMFDGESDSYGKLSAKNLLAEGIKSVEIALNGRHGYVLENISGEQWLVGYSGVQSSDDDKFTLPWAVLTFSAYDVAFGELDFLIKVSAISLAVVAALNVILASLLSTYLVLPIRKLTQQAKHIAEGGYGEQSQISRSDELGELSEVFNSMSLQLKSTVEELSVARDKAELGDRAKTNFLANMSHEIRTPMNAIMGFSQLLMGAGLDKKSNAIVDRIVTSSAILLRIVNDVLDLSKIEAGKMMLAQDECDLRGIIYDQLRLFEGELSHSGLEMGVKISEDVPAKALGDSTKIGQIFTNLIGNAIKYTEHGQIMLSVECIEVIDGVAKIQCSINDTGIGIAQEYIQTLFKAFTQVNESTTREFGGTGLGLTISKRLVNLHGGEIAIESQKSVGSSVSFSLNMPVCESYTHHFLVTEGSDIALNRRGVILAYKNTEVRATIVEEIRHWGVEVTVVDTIDALLNAMEAADSAVFIVDEQLYATSGAYQSIISTAGIDGSLILIETNQDAVHQSTPDNIKTLSKPVRFDELKASYVESLQKIPLPELIRPETEPDLSVLASTKGEEKSILVVDDKEPNRVLMEMMLEGLGYRVSFAHNGLEAVEAVARDSIDLVLMDLHMPVMDGLTATRAIRNEQKNTHTVIVALTAKAMLNDKNECVQNGMNDYLSKPFEHAALMELLDRWLGNKKAENYANIASEIDIVAPEPICIACASASPPNQMELAPILDFDNALIQWRDQNRYLQSLSTFFDRQSALIENLKCLDVLTDKEEMSYLIHAIRGQAGSLSLTRLHNTCAEMECALREEPSNYDRRKWEEMLTALLETSERSQVRSIELCKQFEKESDTTEIKRVSSVPVDLREKAGNLDQMLRRSMVSSKTAFESIEGLLIENSGDQKSVEAIGWFIQQYEFDKAQACLSEIISKLES